MELDANVGDRFQRRDQPTHEQLLARVRAEFDEMPCLRLTRRQAQCLFSLRGDALDRVLTALVNEGTLIFGPDGRYSRRDAARVHPPAPTNAA